MEEGMPLHSDFSCYFQNKSVMLQSRSHGPKHPTIITVGVGGGGGWVVRGCVIPILENMSGTQRQTLYNTCAGRVGLGGGFVRQYKTGMDRIRPGNQPSTLPKCPTAPQDKKERKLKLSREKRENVPHRDVIYCTSKPRPCCLPPFLSVPQTRYPR